MLRIFATLLVLLMGCGSPSTSSGLNALNGSSNFSDTSTVYQQLSLNIQNLVAGQSIRILLQQSNGSEVAFCTGPNLSSSSGINVYTQQNPLSIQTMNITSNQIAIQTPQSGYGSNTGFSMTLYLCATPGISEVVLSVQVDPGVVVTAQIDGQQPLTLSQAPISLPWP